MILLTSIGKSNFVFFFELIKIIDIIICIGIFLLIGLEFDGLNFDFGGFGLSIFIFKSRGVGSLAVGHAQSHG